MKFHPDKCKVIQIHENEPLCTKVLSLAKFRYFLNNDILDYTECEKDLGVLVNKNFKWDDHQLKVLNKAQQMLGITKRTCHFIKTLENVGRFICLLSEVSSSTVVVFGDQILKPKF